MANINGNIFNNLLYGTIFADNIHPGAGADTVYGGSGDDYIDDLGFGLTGSGGNDKFYGGYGNDTLYGWTGTDTLDGGDGNDWLYGEADNDYLDGWTGNDYMSGGTGNDTLLGWTGTDTLYGGDGNDLLNGEQGKDYLYGGLGYDKFVFSVASDSNGSVPDYIGGFDFGGYTTGDKINVSSIDANVWSSGNQAFKWGGTWNKGIGYLYAEEAGNGNTVIKGNVDYDSYAEFAVVVNDGNHGASYWASFDFVL